MLQTAVINSQGTVNGNGRYLRKSDNTFHTGYIDVGFTAYFLPDTQVKPGDVLTDQLDNHSYLLGEIHAVYSNSTQADYYQGSLFQCNTSCQLSRFNPGSKSTFGRDIDGEPEIITEDFPAYIQSSASSSGKSKALLPGNIPVALADRISTPAGTYLVTAIDKIMWDGNLTVVYLIQDNR
jgi:hypothetical protein